MVAMCLLSPGVLVMHEESSCLLDNLFMLRQRDVKELSGVREDGMNVLEFFFVC